MKTQRERKRKQNRAGRTLVCYKATLVGIMKLMAFSLPLVSSTSLAVELPAPVNPTRAQGVEHGWGNASKELVGTAFAAEASPVWFTIQSGIVSEVYYPQIDTPQVGDSQLLFTVVQNGKRFFLEEKKDFALTPAELPGTPRAVLRGVFSSGNVRIEFLKDVVTDPQLPVMRLRYQFLSLPKELEQVFLLHKPTVDGDGAGDVARVFDVGGKTAIVAFEPGHSKGKYQTIMSSSSVTAASVGAVGVNDGWQQLKRFGVLKDLHDAVGPTNIAMTLAVAPAQSLEFFVGFGPTLESSVTTTLQEAEQSAEQVIAAFDTGWRDYHRQLLESSPWIARLDARMAEDVLWHATVIKSHEDRTYPGAIIASLGVPSLPDGLGVPDSKNSGGYHLVWARDLYKSANALLGVGDVETAFNCLKFMRRQEMSNGRMAQNTWVDGRPYWVGEQMDEEAYPLILAAQLRQQGVVFDSDLSEYLARRLNIVLTSKGYTGQERWEEESGFSPNTLSILAAAAMYWGYPEKAKEFLAITLQKTVSRKGPLSSKPYFLRITQRGLPDAGDILEINNGGPRLPEATVLDGGFLEWLRWFPNPEQTFGVQGQELLAVIENTLGLYDDPANGVCQVVGGHKIYRRYNSDKYGFQGNGGPWPFLSAERRLPEIARSPEIALEVFADQRKFLSGFNMCPEQVVAVPVDAAHPDGIAAMPAAASPLVWCHADMLELARTGSRIDQ
jgi:glucoamylase